MDKNVYKRMMEQAVPSAALIQKTKYKMKKENPIMIRRSFSTVVAAVLALFLFSTTAYAAWYFLKPSEVAEKLEDYALSAAFNSETAININQSVTSGDYTFALLAIVSGKDISDQRIIRNGEILSDRTYSVIAIQNTDGSPMLTFDNPEAEQFYISLYVKGFSPGQINSYMLSGGGTMMVLDGVLYIITDVDDISMFADRGVYLGINTGFSFGEAFSFNEETGEITPNPKFDGVSVIFDLPLDPSLADSEKAQALLDKLLGDKDEVINEFGENRNSVAFGATSRFIEDTALIRDTIGPKADFDFEAEVVEESLISQQEMTKAEYTEWIASQRIEHREMFEKYLKYFDEGRTITVYTFEDGSITIQVNV